MNSCQYNTVTTNGIAICLCILANVQHNIVTDTLHTSSAHRHPNDTQWDGQQDVITYRHTIEISLFEWLYKSQQISKKCSLLKSVVSQWLHCDAEHLMCTTSIYTSR